MYVNVCVNVVILQQYLTDYNRNRTALGKEQPCVFRIA